MPFSDWYLLANGRSGNKIVKIFSAFIFFSSSSSSAIFSSNIKCERAANEKWNAFMMN